METNISIAGDLCKQERFTMFHSFFSLLYKEHDVNFIDYTLHNILFLF